MNGQRTHNKLTRLFPPSLPLIFALLTAPLYQSSRAGEYPITPDVVYGHKAGMALTYDVIQPKKNPNGAAVAFIMSGGWFSGWVPPAGFVSEQAPSGFQHFKHLVDGGYTLFIIRHGSAPQFKVPEAVADVQRAIRHIRLTAQRFDIDPQRIGVYGASAGGHLALMLGTASDEGDSASKDPVATASDRVAAVVAYFPPVDIREWVGPSKRFPALDFDKEKAIDVSPITKVTSDDAPTLLIHGDKDDLVKLDNSERIYTACQEAGVPSKLIVMEGARHGFGGEQAQQASEALIKWFDKYLSKDAPAATETEPQESKQLQEAAGTE